MFVSRKSIILHIPKTGGQFVKSMLRAVNIDGTYKGFNSHININKLVNEHHFKLDDLKKKYIIAFVRHPVTRLQSIWSYYRRCTPIYVDFNDYVNTVLTSSHHDLMVTDCRKFIWDSVVPVNFVGRYENLVNDLITGLENAGEEFDKQIILDNYDKKINNSGNWKDKAIYKPELLSELLEVERPVLESFYKE